MGHADYFKKGDWNAVCKRCNFKYKASELKLEDHTGLRVCPECWEPRHPQERIRTKPDRQAVPWVNPENEIEIDIFGTDYCALWDSGTSQWDFNNSKWCSE